MAKRYNRHGLNKTQRRVVSFLTERGIEGASVLEIGGGIGEIQVELLRRGARRVTNTEISRGYEPAAAELLATTGLRDRVTRTFVDIAAEPEAVQPADVVVLHRVVCCYHDSEQLVAAAADHARRLLVFSYPSADPMVRALIGWDNLVRRVRRNEFRAFVHSPAALVAAVESQGMRRTYQHRGWPWRIAGFER